MDSTRPGKVEIGRAAGRTSGGFSPDLERFKDGRSVNCSHSGIEIVDNNVPLWTARTEWRIDSLPSVVVGPEDEERQIVLYKVGNIVQLGDGRVMVEDRGLRELLVLDSSQGARSNLGVRLVVVWEVFG